jgi:indolepyruvate ferredoxin oxidoreductase
MFVLGFAYQLGALPLSAQAIEQALALNGEAVAMNQAAFRWGRRAAADLSAVETLVKPEQTDGAPLLSQSLDEIVARRAAFLTAYQDAAYAARYRALVERVKAVEAATVPGAAELSEAVARYLFKLMAYKDEYEVARLHATHTWAQVGKEVAGENLRLEFHLAPPILGRRDPNTGQLRKMAFGPWILPVFRMLAKLKFLRGTPFDPFGYTQERRTERRLIEDYEQMLDEILDRLTPENRRLGVALASIPEKIRGFGHVKARHLKAAKADEAALMDQFRAGPAPLLKAAE